MTRADRMTNAVGGMGEERRPAPIQNTSYRIDR